MKSKTARILLTKRMTWRTRPWSRSRLTVLQSHGMSMPLLRAFHWMPLQRCFVTPPRGTSISLLMKQDLGSDAVVRSPHHTSSWRRSPSSARLNAGNASGEDDYDYAYAKKFALLRHDLQPFGLTCSHLFSPFGGQLEILTNWVNCCVMSVSL